MNEDLTALPAGSVKPSARTLTPLSSGFQEEEHGAYAAYLSAGLQQPKVFNIALTGGYGSGKSSVIEHIENSNKFKVLNVAISSLGNNLNEPRLRQTLGDLADPPADSGVEVRDAIARLDPVVGEVIRLVRWDGFTLQQVADLLDVPSSTARNRYQRAKADLRSSLGAFACGY